MSDSVQPHGLQIARLSCPWDSPGKKTGVGCHALLQGIFLTQESNLCLLHIPALAGRFFTTSATGGALSFCFVCIKSTYGSVKKILTWLLQYTRKMIKIVMQLWIKNTRCHVHRQRMLRPSVTTAALIVHTRRLRTEPELPHHHQTLQPPTHGAPWEGSGWESTGRWSQSAEMCTRGVFQWAQTPAPSPAGESASFLAISGFL